MGVQLPSEPITRKEKYLAKAAGQAVEIPAEPITREEAYLEAIANAGGGGGGTSDYNQLNNKPQINGTTLIGNKTASQLGLASTADLEGKVDKIEGKGLSTNDYTNADKAIVGGVTAALAGKVDKVFGKGLSSNDFTDEYKDAISDNATAISGIKNGESINSFSGVESALSGVDDAIEAIDSKIDDATVYPYADVITIEDAIPANLAECTVKIEPVQDLHGYDHPWVGGAGKNKCAGTYTTTTNGGVTFTANSDGTVSATNTSSGYAYVNSSEFTIKAGTYIFSGAPSGNSKYVLAIYSGATLISQISNGTETSVTFESDTNVVVRCVVNGADVTTGVTYKPMIRLATETDPTFAPYTNICPITGHTEASVQRDGKNLFDENDVEIGTAWNGYANADRARIIIPCKPNTTYTFSMNGTNNTDLVVYGWFKSTPALAGNVSFPQTFTTESDSEYIVFGFNKTSISESDIELMKLQLEEGTKKTTYEPYADKTYTIALGDTIYGGTVDFDTGVMTVTHGIVDLGTLNWSKSTLSGHERYYVGLSSVLTAGNVISDCFAFSDYDDLYNHVNDEVISINTTSASLEVHSSYFESIYDASQFKTAMDGHYACYELATQFTIQLTPQQIQLLQGQNTLTASTGQISVTVNGVSGAIGSLQEQVNGITRAIGWDDARNIFNGIIRQGYVDTTTGEYVGNAMRWLCTSKQECKANTTYTISASSSFLTRRIAIVYFDSNDTLISYSNYDHESSPIKINATITTPSNTAYIVVNIANQRNADGYNITPSDVWNVQIEEGTQTTPYIPYHPVIGTAVEELLDKVPDAPTTDGTYSLQVTVASGVPTYSWVSGS